MRHMHEKKARTLSYTIKINDCVVAVPKGTVVLPPMRDKVRPVCVERHRDLGAQIWKAPC